MGPPNQYAALRVVKNVFFETLSEPVEYVLWIQFSNLSYILVK